MKFWLARTSDWRRDGVNLDLYPKGAYAEIRPMTSDDGADLSAQAVAIDLESLDDLMRLVNEVGEIIVGPENELEIYDDYRE